MTRGHTAGADPLRVRFLQDAEVRTKLDSKKPSKVRKGRVRLMPRALAARLISKGLVQLVEDA